MDAQETRWQEFEDLGEIEVRKRLAARLWSEEKEALARQWIEFREARDSSTSADSLALAREANDLARSANDLARSANISASEANAIARRAASSASLSADAARTNNIIATLALIAAVIAIALSIIGLFLKRRRSEVMEVFWGPIDNRRCRFFDCTRYPIHCAKKR